MPTLPIQTPCGTIDVEIPDLPFPFPPPLPSLDIFPLPFPPPFDFPLPDCDVIKQAVGAKDEPPEDSLP